MSWGLTLIYDSIQSLLIWANSITIVGDSSGNSFSLLGLLIAFPLMGILWRFLHR